MFLKKRGFSDTEDVNKIQFQSRLHEAAEG